MHIKSLLLTDFRNYSSCTIEFCDKINVIYGNNAQGKTNILEAIYLSSQAKSHRTSNDREMIRHGCEKTNVNMTFCTDKREMMLSIAIQQQQSKSIFLNDVPIKKIGRLIENFKVVLFAPDDLQIVKKGPETRRKFFDNHISMMRIAYFSNIQIYQRLLEQKNKLLKLIRDGKYEKDTLFAWNYKFAEFIATIMRYRFEFCEQIEKEARNIHESICGQNLSCIYMPNITEIIKETTFEDAKKSIYEKLEREKEKEIAAGTALYGVHRDDYLFKIDNMEARAFGSQGQQRTIALALKLAQSECIKKEFGEYPLILLDDIMSELDMSRREFLISKIKDKQIIITCTDKEIYIKNKNVRYFYVNNGSVIKEL